MTEHGELPLPDYDHLQIGSLMHRIRSLDAAGVQTLLDYERAHGNRGPIVTLLANRLKVAARGGPAGDREARRRRAGGGQRLKIDTMSMTAGPSSTMNRVGRMQRISGKITLTGICIAFSSARCRRLSRISCACVRSTSAIETP
jgi:hypothetical protein